MIDWFVLLIPLVLLPIIFMLAYVGCGRILGLDQFGEAPKDVIFNYDPTLDDYIISIEATFEGTVAFINEDLEPEIKQISFIRILRTNEHSSTEPVKNVPGETDLVPGSIPQTSIDGNIRCHCEVWRKEGVDNPKMPVQVSPWWLDKPILADMPAPSFTLTPDSFGSFNII